MAFTFQHAHDGTRSLGRRLVASRGTVAALIGALGAFARALAGLPFPRRRKIDTRFARFRQADSNRLFGIAGSVFPFTDVMHFLADEFTGLRRGRLALTAVSLSSSHCFLFWHGFTPSILDSEQ
jgi:hypothetical protein